MNKRKFSVQVFLCLLVLMFLVNGCHRVYDDDRLPGEYTIAGTVTGDVAEGVTIYLTGGASVISTTTDAEGNYSFTALPSRTYTVIPVLDDYTFDPLFTAVAVNGADRAGINFTATYNPSGGGSLAITSFAPASGKEGDGVVITGKNFSATPASNIVKFNGVTATVTECTTTTIVTSVPSGATTGRITVTVGANTVTSATDFTVDVVLPSFAGYYTEEESSQKALPCYWTVTENGTGVTRVSLEVDDSGLGSIAFSPTVLSNGVVHTAGFYTDSDGKMFPCYWTGADRNPLPEGTYGSVASSLALLDGTLYVAGIAFDDEAGDIPVPCYWRVTGDTTEGPIRLVDASGIATAITVSGSTVHIAGQYTTDEVESEGEDGPIYKTMPCYWSVVDGEITTVNLGGSGSSSITSSIAVFDGTVYITGTFGDEGGPHPCYWTVTDGEPTGPIPLAEPDVYYGVVFSVTASGGKVYMAGAYGEPEASYTICYWTLAGSSISITNLSELPGTIMVYPFSISVSGGKVFLGGIYADADETVKPLYWTGSDGVTPSPFNLEGDRIMTTIAALLLGF